MNNLEQLRMKAEEAKREFEEALAANRSVAIKDALGIIEMYGLTAAELGLEVEVKAGGKDDGRKQFVRIKYRHPRFPDKTWTGRGKQPHWIKESGLPLEELLVKDY